MDELNDGLSDHRKGISYLVARVAALEDGIINLVKQTDADSSMADMAVHLYCIALLGSLEDIKTPGDSPAPSAKAEVKG